jgi:cytochrome b
VPVHEFSSDFMAVMVIVHIAGAVLSSKIHRENLVLAMVTGYKKRNHKK